MLKGSSLLNLNLLFTLDINIYKFFNNYVQLLIQDLHIATIVILFDL